MEYSEKAGFFIRSFVHQRREGRVWQTISATELEEDVSSEGLDRLDGRRGLAKKGTHRWLETFRPVSRDQAIRLFIDGYEDHGGMMTVILDALDKAGIAPLEPLE